MATVADLQTSIVNLTDAAANLITLETAAIAAASANNDGDAIAASVANINSVTASLTAAAAGLPGTTAPVTPAAAATTLAPTPSP